MRTHILGATTTEYVKQTIELAMFLDVVFTANLLSAHIVVPGHGFF